MKDREINYLMKRAVLHEPDAFTELMQFYMKDMYKVAISILRNDEDAADAIQDTILTCWEKLHTLKQEKYFKTWLTRILLNKCYDIRDKYADTTSLEESEEQGVCDEYNVELKEALATLDEKYRVPMMLFYGQGYPIKKIAELLHIPISTVQTRLARGRQRLAGYYGFERSKS